jgi:hypothetical protein
MAQPLIRYQQTGNFHTITFSCFHRKPYLGSPAARDLFERSLETMRLRYGFHVIGYVVMPEHVHLLLSEPKLAVLAKPSRHSSCRSPCSATNAPSGRPDITTSTSGLRASTSSSCATSTATREPVASSHLPNNGDGQASAITSPESVELWRSNPSGPPEGANPPPTHPLGAPRLASETWVVRTANHPSQIRGIIAGMATIHISEAEAARDFAGLLDRFRAGAEIIIDASPAIKLSVLPAPRGRLLSGSTALAAKHEEETGDAPVLDPLFRGHRGDHPQPSAPRHLGVGLKPWAESSTQAS